MSARERLSLYGCDERLPSRLSLRAGPVSFELVGGRFGPLRVNGHEVWHGLAFLFRDAAWGTPEPVFEQVRAIANRAELRRSPDAKAALAFSVDKDVVLHMVEPPKNGWVKLRHADGSSGYGQISAFWGL